MGVKKVSAWTVYIGDVVPQAAGVIRTDFERIFIRTQTIAYDDYIACKGEAGAIKCVPGVKSMSSKMRMY